MLTANAKARSHDAESLVPNSDRPIAPIVNDEVKISEFNLNSIQTTEQMSILKHHNALSYLTPIPLEFI